MDKRNRKLNLSAISLLLCAVIVTGCTPPSAPSPAPTTARDDRITYIPDPSNPSNVTIRIEFLNPEKTSRKPIVINYHSVLLQRQHTNVFVNISGGPAQGVSQCVFRIPRSEVKECRVHLLGADSKPVGEANVARELRLGDPDSSLKEPVSTSERTCLAGDLYSGGYGNPNSHWTGYSVSLSANGATNWTAYTLHSPGRITNAPASFYASGSNTWTAVFDEVIFQKTNTGSSIALPIYALTVHKLKVDSIKTGEFILIKDNTNTITLLKSSPAGH